MSSNSASKMTSGGDRVLVIQPHSDDFALSCGGTVTRGVFQNGDILRCLTVFSEYVDDGAQDGTGTALRQQEDHRALDYLGGRVEFAGYRDALCRGMRFGFFIREGLFKKERALLPEITGRIRRAISEHRPGKVFIPSAMGWHYDHRLVYMAALDAFRETFREPGHRADIYLFEDYPYCDEGRYPYWARLEELSGELDIEPVYEDIAGYIDKKSELICFYKSQLKDLKPADVRAKMKQLAESTAIEGRCCHPGAVAGGVRAAERLWRIRGFK